MDSVDNILISLLKRYLFGYIIVMILGYFQYHMSLKDQAAFDHHLKTDPPLVFMDDQLIIRCAEVYGYKDCELKPEQLKGKEPFADISINEENAVSAITQSNQSLRDAFNRNAPLPEQGFSNWVTRRNQFCDEWEKKSGYVDNPVIDAKCIIHLNNLRAERLNRSYIDREMREEDAKREGKQLPIVQWKPAPSTTQPSPMAPRQEQQSLQFPEPLPKYLSGVKGCESMTVDNVFHCVEISTDSANAAIFQALHKIGRDYTDSKYREWDKRQEDICNKFVKSKNLTDGQELTMKEVCYVEQADALIKDIEAGKF